MKWKSCLERDSAIILALFCERVAVMRLFLNGWPRRVMKFRGDRVAMVVVDYRLDRKDERVVTAQSVTSDWVFQSRESDMRASVGEPPLFSAGCRAIVLENLGLLRTSALVTHPRNMATSWKRALLFLCHLRGSFWYVLINYPN